MPEVNEQLLKAGGRAAAATAPVAKRVAEIYGRLFAQTNALREANAQVLVSENPEAEFAKMLRPLWSMRHETLAQARQAAEAAIAHIDAQVVLIDQLLGEYAPTNPKTGEPLEPGWTPVAMPAAPEA